MTLQASPQLLLILNSVLLGIYAVTLLLGIYRFVIAYKKHIFFLPFFFGLVSIVTVIELAIQIYSVIAVIESGDISATTVVIINLYSMIFETAVMFVLADYWGETSQILTKKSTEEQIKQKKHYVRLIILIMWILALSAFIAYSEVTNSFTQTDHLFLNILILGCQGIGVTWLLWANIMQIIMGYRMSVALRQYEDWVSLTIRKVQFCFLFWISSLLNLARSIFLIIGTLVIAFGYEDYSYVWLFGYVYGFANVPVILIYLMGFSTKPLQTQKQSTLIQDRKSNDSQRSRRQTQLSRSSRSQH